ncbi:MAG: 50S ribosomal protein L6 [bacterium]
MSKLIKKPIILPKNTTIEVKENEVIVSGPKGKVSKKLNLNYIKIDLKDNNIFISKKQDNIPNKKVDRFVNKMLGTAWSIINSMVKGVNEGFKKELLVVGLGWKVNQKDKGIELLVGYSHPVIYYPPEGILLKVEGNQKVVVEGLDKELVGQVAANIRNFRKPDSYKGKGVRYADEELVLKESKKGAKGK